MSSARLSFAATALLLACGASDASDKERYVGELVERCAVGFGQTRSTRSDFQLVLTTDDGTHYRTNIPICHPDAAAVSPGMLELSESECFLDGEDVFTGDHHLTEGQIVLSGDSASVLYRWRVSEPEGPVAACEVENTLLRVE